MPWRPRSPRGQTLWVVAPATEQSGVSSALSLHTPVRLIERGPQRFALTGTPADCAYVGLVEVTPRLPDLVVSGINHGANLAEDVLYSGTVAAALEARLQDVPAMAISHAAWGRHHDFAPAAQIALSLAKRLLARPLPRDVVLNVNVPKGATVASEHVVTKLGRRHYARQVRAQQDPRGRPYFWIGGPEIFFDDLPGGDCNAVALGQVSLTPIHLDMTHYRCLKDLSEWTKSWQTSDSSPKPPT